MTRTLRSKHFAADGQFVLHHLITGQAVDNYAGFQSGQSYRHRA
ncbi:MAG: hypothetical protein VW985_00720 [Gammaproteobacteria bacterium]